MGTMGFVGVLLFLLVLLPLLWITICAYSMKAGGYKGTTRTNGSSKNRLNDSSKYLAINLSVLLVNCSTIGKFFVNIDCVIFTAKYYSKRFLDLLLLTKR